MRVLTFLSFVNTAEYAGITSPISAEATPPPPPPGATTCDCRSPEIYKSDILKIYEKHEGDMDFYLCMSFILENRTFQNHLTQWLVCLPRDIVGVGRSCIVAISL